MKLFALELEYYNDPRTTIALPAAHQVRPDTGHDYGLGGMSNGQRLPTSWTQNLAPSWACTGKTLDEVNLNLTHMSENG